MCVEYGLYRLYEISVKRYVYKIKIILMCKKKVKRASYLTIRESCPITQQTKPQSQ